MIKTVSIIVPCLNASAVIDRCLQSVFLQESSNIDLILIDGVSTDNTRGIIAKYLAASESNSNISARLISEPDAGIYDAMNKGIGLANGEVILFLGADDYLIDSLVIADVIKKANEHPEAAIVYGQIEVRYVDGAVRLYDAGEAVDFGQLMVLGNLPSQATFIKPHLFEEIGKFDTRYKLAADYDWYMRALTQSARFLRIDRLCTSFFMGGASSDFAVCRPELDCIQNSSSYYDSADWQKRRIELYQKEHIRLRLREAELENILANKRQAIKYHESEELKAASERAILLEEIAKLREGVDALENERSKLTRMLHVDNGQKARVKKAPDLMPFWGRMFRKFAR